MQIAYFSDGSFVIHGAMETPVLRASAWFDKTGRMINGETISRNTNRTYNVRPNSATWKALQTIGARVHDTRHVIR
jgi:hypothetical protein